MYKLIKKSSNQKMFFLHDESAPESKDAWYFLANHVFAFASKINIGDVFDIQTEKKNGDNYIIRIMKEGASAASTNGYKKDFPFRKKEDKPAFKPYSKSPEEQEQIRRCNSMTAASVIVAALINTGAVKPEAAMQTVTSMFDGLLAKLEDGLIKREETVVS